MHACFKVSELSFETKHAVQFSNARMLTTKNERIRLIKCVNISDYSVAEYRILPNETAIGEARFTAGM